MSSDDTEYYRQRATDERAMALKSERQDVATIHEELAREYQALVDKVELRPKLRIATRRRVSASA
jgi:hypothetical protein